MNTDDKVLDLGCATGYSTAVLASLAARVVAIVDSDPGLAAATRANLAVLGLSNVEVLDGTIEAASVPSWSPST